MYDSRLPLWLQLARLYSQLWLLSWWTEFQKYILGSRLLIPGFPLVLSDAFGWCVCKWSWAWHLWVSLILAALLSLIYDLSKYIYSDPTYICSTTIVWWVSLAALYMLHSDTYICFVYIYIYMWPMATRWTHRLWGCWVSVICFISLRLLGLCICFSTS